MKTVSFILAVSFLALCNLSALDPKKDEIVLSVHFDKDDLKIKEPYPVVANLVIYKDADAVLSYGGGAMNDYNYALSPKEARDLKSLLDKYAAYEKREENKVEKVHQFDGRGKILVDKKALTEIEALGLEITTKIIKGIK